MRLDGESLTVWYLFGGHALHDSNTWENETYYPELQLGDFSDNYLRFHPNMPVVIKGPSSELAVRCAPRAFRFIHIDASHMYPAVRADLLISRELALPTGSVVAIDDIRSPHTPGVWAAAWEAVFLESLVPLVVTKSKLYCSWGGGGDELVASLLKRLVGGPRFRLEHHPLGDREILRVVLEPGPSDDAHSRLLRWVPPVVVDTARAAKRRMSLWRRPASNRPSLSPLPPPPPGKRGWVGANPEQARD
jgi:hypothetical protein